MYKRLNDVAVAPTAITAFATSGRRQSGGPNLGAIGSRITGPVQVAVPMVLDRLPADEVTQLLRLNGSRPKLDRFLPHRSRRSRWQQTLRLARNLGAAASVTMFAVDLVSEVKRAAEAGGRSSTEGRSRSGEGESEDGSRSHPRSESGSRGQGGRGTAAAASRARKATGTRKATPAKKVARAS